MRKDALKAGPDHPPLLDMFAAEGVHFKESVSMMWREVNDELVGGFAWSDYVPGQMLQAHFVGKPGQWMTRELIRRSFTYPFQELGVRVILACLPSYRDVARKVALGMGFRELGVIPGVDVHMLTLVPEDCKRWLALPSRGWNG